MDKKEKDREYKKVYMREYRKTEQYKNYMREYRLKNKEKLKKQQQELDKQPHRIKCHRIANWKQMGVICDDFNQLYEDYINCNNCEHCNIELIHGNYGSNRKHLDHDHDTGLFRNVLCHKCNTQLKNK